MRRGSALILAIWIIAILSIMVASFAVEAYRETGANIHIEERNRVNRLMEGAREVAELVILKFNDVQTWSEDEDLEKLREDDRWIQEKRDLKEGTCKIGPLLLDSDNPESGVVTITIALDKGNEQKLNINNLYNGGDSKYQTILEMIMLACNIPEELDTPEDGRINLRNQLIASWNDWRDEVESATSIDNKEEGAEKSWYDDEYDDEKTPDEYRYAPRNGAIPTIKELEHVRGFKDYPQVLTGGVLNPWEKNKEDQIIIPSGGILKYLDVYGTGKVNVNAVNDGNLANLLMVLPGFYEENEDEQDDARQLAQAVVSQLKVMPTHRDDFNEEREWWPYTDINDLNTRIEDADVEKSVGTEASNYLYFAPDTSSEFTVTIVGESMGIKHVVQARCYIKDSAIRYYEWKEGGEIK